MDQPTFADLEYQSQMCKTRREPFLERSCTAKRATGKPTKNTEPLTPLFGVGKLLTAKRNWGRRARCNRPGPARGFAPPVALANTVQAKTGPV